MATFYARRLVQAILRVFRCRIASSRQRALLVVMLCPFMSARSLSDAAQTSGVDRHLLYETVDGLSDQTVVSQLRRTGLARLASHLTYLWVADSSVRSRKCVTLCGDDFTRAVRGDMGGLAHPCYSGADKSVVYGLRTEALIAVIGEGEDIIVLDVRVIPPRNRLGRPRSSHSEWMMEALLRLEKSLVERGVSIEGCYLSVDSAYAAGWFVDAAEALGLKVVSELKANVSVWSRFWTPIPAAIYFALYGIGHSEDFKPLGGEPEVKCLRHQVETRVYGRIVVLWCDLGPERKRYFTRDLTMKAITIRRIAKRRWQLERVFWNLKQLLGINTIHQQTRRRILVRVYLAFMVAQAAKDAAIELKITVDKLHREIRRNPQLIGCEIGITKASVLGDLLKSAPDEGLAA